jgi:hypothetical protein
MIDLHHVVAFLNEERKSELEIHNQINRVLGNDTISYAIVGKHGRQYICSKENPVLESGRFSVPDFTLDDKISSVLHAEPFLSIRQIVRKVLISKTTVYRYLTQSMG